MRLQSETGKYEKVVAVPLVSDYKTDEFSAVNHAQKAIIKGVFSLLEGKTTSQAEAEIVKTNPKLAGFLKTVLNIEKLAQIEPSFYFKRQKTDNFLFNLP